MAFPRNSSSRKPSGGFLKSWRLGGRWFTTPLSWCRNVFFCLVLLSFTARGADTLSWQTNLVSADIKASTLPQILERIASATGWQVFVEPNTTRQISAKFKELPPGDALHLLLGDLSFALVPGTNTASKLFVFRTARERATVLVRSPRTAAAAQGRKIPNELIVRLKPGAKIDDLARLLGAKVLGRIDSLNAYRLQFNDAQAADSAREQLASNSDVASVDSNFAIDRPPELQALGSSTVPPPQLQLKPPPANGRIIVGLIDTAVQPLGNNLDGFLLKPISVAGDAQLDPNSPSHGTSMAETILRSLEGVTKGTTSVQILPVDVYGPNPSTSTFDVANGIVQGVNAGANVINLSLGSQGDSSFLHDVIDQVSKQNIPLFAAAGNEPVTTPFYPAAYSGVMAVTAIDQGQVASYANRGSFVSLGAPGTSVIYYDGQPYYAVGTSTATAIVSGMAAGYMDTTHSSVDKMQTFLRSALGVKLGTGP